MWIGDQRVRTVTIDGVPVYDDETTTHMHTDLNATIAAAQLAAKVVSIVFWGVNDKGTFKSAGEIAAGPNDFKVRTL